MEVGQGGAGGWGQGGGWGRLELWAGEGEGGGAIGRVRGLGQILWPWGHCRDFGFDSELGRDKIRRSTYVLACLQCRGQGVSLRGLSGAQCCFCHSACPCPPPGLAAAPASAPDHPVTSCPGHSLWQEKAVFFLHMVLERRDLFSLLPLLSVTLSPPPSLISLKQGKLSELFPPRGPWPSDCASRAAAVNREEVSVPILQVEIKRLREREDMTQSLA